MRLLLSLIAISNLFGCSKADEFLSQRRSAESALKSCWEEKNRLSATSAAFKQIEQKCSALDAAFANAYGFHPGG